MSGWPEKDPFEVESAWIPGWDFAVVFDDALVGGLEEELDELDEYLAASEGVTEVPHEDREVLHLRVIDLDVSDVEEKYARRSSGPVSMTRDEEACLEKPLREGDVPVSPSVLCWR